MRFLSIKTDDLDESPNYIINVNNLGPAYNTRSHNDELYHKFNTNNNYKYFLETAQLPQKIMLETIFGEKVLFNIDFQRLYQINMLPRESRMFELFYTSEQVYGGKKKRKKNNIIKKKKVEKSTVKKQKVEKKKLEKKKVEKKKVEKKKVEKKVEKKKLKKQ